MAEDKLLDRIDQSIDVNVIIMERCMDSMFNISTKHTQPVLYGEEKSPLDSPGFFDGVNCLFNAVRNDTAISDLTGSELEKVIKEYLEEKKVAQEAALESGKAQRAEVKVASETTVPAKGGK
jgi:predicted ATP-grasp superfamily ATP-dependent carboligase